MLILLGFGLDFTCELLALALFADADLTLALALFVDAELALSLALNILRFTCKGRRGLWWWPYMRLLWGDAELCIYRLFKSII